MKTANYKLLTITLFALLLMGCHKDSQVETITPVVTENGITKNNNQFTFNWTVDYPGLIRSLVLISDNESVEGAISYGSDMLTDDKNFSATTNNLTFSDTYYYCYLVWNDYGSYRTEAKELVPTPTPTPSPSPSPTPTPTPTPTSEYVLVLNELNGDTKFIELYNKGDIDLSLEGIYIKKDDKEEPIWTGETSMVIPAYSYFVLYSEVVAENHPELPSEYFFQSGLSAKKSCRYAIYMPDGTEIDVFTRGTTGEWGTTMSNVSPLSYARTPDGGNWKLTDPTPGTSNPADGDDIPQD